jgi:hypothetical protein
MTTNNETNTNAPFIGIKAWGTVKAPAQKKQFVKREEDELPRLKYLKFKEGTTDIRLVTDIGGYAAAKLTLPKSKGPYGDSIRSAWPLYDNCPIMTEMKVEPKQRYMALAIDRADGLVKIFDMAPTIFKSIKNILDAKNKRRAADDQVAPINFDISVVYSPTAAPTDKYAVVGMDSEPGLSEEDKAGIIAQLGSMENLEKILVKQLIVPKPETVKKRLLELGWDGKEMPKKVYKDDEKVETKTKLAEATDDDYDFTKAAAVESTETTEDAAE